MTEKDDKDFHIRVAEDLGAIKEGIRGIHERLDLLNGKTTKTIERVSILEEWKASIGTKITLISAGAGILFTFVFDWLKKIINH